MEDLKALLAAKDNAAAVMEAARQSANAAKDRGAEERIGLDRDYLRAVRAFNVAEDAYHRALREMETA